MASRLVLMLACALATAPTASAMANEDGVFLSLFGQCLVQLGTDCDGGGGSTSILDGLDEIITAGVSVGGSLVCVEIDTKAPENCSRISG